MWFIVLEFAFFWRMNFFVSELGRDEGRGVRG